MALFGGGLEVESSPGNGAAFALIVPLETKREKDERRIQEIVGEIQKAKTYGNRIRVLLADDHTVVRQGLAAMLNLHPDIDIIGEGSNGEEAVNLARQLQPDVILDGLKATRIIHAESPHIRIIGLSMHDKQDQAAEMTEAGATADCTKDGDSNVLLSAIRGKAGAGGGKVT